MILLRIRCNFTNFKFNRDTAREKLAPKKYIDQCHSLTRDEQEFNNNVSRMEWMGDYAVGVFKIGFDALLLSMVLGWRFEGAR